VYAYCRWLCEEILRNKFFSNYNHSCFIHIVSFELELTSYIGRRLDVCVTILPPAPMITHQYCSLNIYEFSALFQDRRFFLPLYASSVTLIHC
jgi:hypothetical protein